jgi:hypothetical protein
MSDVNYEALGQYTAARQEAHDALVRRLAILNNLGTALLRLSEDPDAAIEGEQLIAEIREAERYASIARLAVDRANAAAPAARAPEITTRAALATPRHF